MLRASSYSPVTHDPKYGPHAQTPTQRAYVLQQMRATNPDSYTRVPAHVATLFERYVAGELSWTQVQALRYAAEPYPYRRSK